MNQDCIGRSLRTFVHEFAARGAVFATLGTDHRSAYWPGGTLAIDLNTDTGSHRIILNQRVLPPAIGHGSYRVPAASPDLRLEVAPGGLDYWLGVVLTLLLASADSDLAQRVIDDCQAKLEKEAQK